MSVTYQLWELKNGSLMAIPQEQIYKAPSGYTNSIIFPLKAVASDIEQLNASFQAAFPNGTSFAYLMDFMQGKHGVTGSYFIDTRFDVATEDYIIYDTATSQFRLGDVPLVDSVIYFNGRDDSMLINDTECPEHSNVVNTYKMSLELLLTDTAHSTLFYRILSSEYTVNKHKFLKLERNEECLSFSSEPHFLAELL